MDVDDTVGGRDHKFRLWNRCRGFDSSDGQRDFRGTDEKMVILPFADYTPADSPNDYWRRNIEIMEALQDEMLRFGYRPAISEDVFSYLSEKKIIYRQEGPQVRSAANAVLQAELAKDWSDTMKMEIARVLAKNKEMQRYQKGSGLNAQYRSIALDHTAIRDIGTAFNADYVVRGRIMVFKNGREDSFNPFQTGVLPFFSMWDSGPCSVSRKPTTMR